MRQLALAVLTCVTLATVAHAQPGAILEGPGTAPPFTVVPPLYVTSKPDQPDTAVRTVRHSHELVERSTLPPIVDSDLMRESRCGVPALLFRAGAGFYYMKPYFDTNPAFAQSVNFTTATTASTTTMQNNFDWGYRMAPLVWVEYVHQDMLGIRARWWQFDCAPPNLGATNSFTPGGVTTQVTSAFPLGLGIISNPNGAAAGFNDTLVFQSGLRMNVYDFEFTKELRSPIGWLAFSAGARYAEVNQTYNAFLQSTPAAPGASTVVTTLLSDHDFRGAGGTISLDAGYTICNTGFSLFCTGRGSLLYGVGRERASLSTVTTNPLGAVTTQSLDPSATQDRVLPVGEIEIGAEYARYIGRCRLSIRTALVNQIWFGAGNAANNETITGTGTLLTVPVTQAADNHMNLGFLGLTTTIGIQY
jgi:hypothetical protein